MEKNNREVLFEMFNEFMDDYYGENSTVEAMYMIVKYPTTKHEPGKTWECPVRIDPNRQHFYNYINKAFNKDLCIMNYTNRYDISTGKPNPYHRIIGIKISYKNGISDKLVELKINMADYRKKKEIKDIRRN